MSKAALALAVVKVKQDEAEQAGSVDSTELGWLANLSSAYGISQTYLSQAALVWQYNEAGALAA